MTTNRPRILRGALVGAVSATVWRVQQRADMRVFAVPYDDAELPGTGVLPALGSRAAAPPEPHARTRPARSRSGRLNRPDRGIPPFWSTSDPLSGSDVDQFARAA